MISTGTAKLLAAGAAAVLLVLSSAWVGWSLRDGRAQADARRAAEAVTRRVTVVAAQDRRSEDRAADVGARQEATQERIRVVYRDIIKETPAHVTPAADAHCVVPLGFVRAHDAAAAGVPVPAAPAGSPDDAPSGVALSAVSSTVSENYGVTAQLRAQVLGWQEFWPVARDACRAPPQ